MGKIFAFSLILMFLLFSGVNCEIPYPDFVPIPIPDFKKEKQVNSETYESSAKGRQTENRRSNSHHRPGEIWKDPYLGMEFVWVPGGCFEMGCGSWQSSCDDDEKPVHAVCVDGFWMGRYEVTQGQWKRLMGNNPSQFKEGDNYPVENVSWIDVQEFIRELNERTGYRYSFRLPYEAEWEYACRSGGKREKYCGGDDVDRLAWYSGNSGFYTNPGGAKAPNGLGIYDMSGNVWEWCMDWYDGDYYERSPRNNPHGPKNGSNRVGRGGSWFDLPMFVRSAYRYRFRPGGRSGNLGFRLVRTK